MTLLLITDEKEKKKAQARLVGQLTALLPPQGLRTIGFPGGKVDNLIYAAGEGGLWASFVKPAQGSENPRHWNAFGIFDAKRPSQDITVEINIPTGGNSSRVAGFFARDVETGDVFLMHSAKVGGGRVGIGKNAFLVWSMESLEEVHDDGGFKRSGIVVAKLGSEDIVGRVSAFVRKVHAFKAQAATGKLDAAGFQRRVQEYQRYSKEFAGRKKGVRLKAIDYVSYHGDVVQALYEERTARLKPGEEVFNSVRIDLYVKRNGALAEVYEVKTSIGTQSLYTALGQLLTHSITETASSRMILVLPHGEPLPEPIVTAVDRHGIEVRRFKLVGDRTKRVELT